MSNWSKDNVINYIGNDFSNRQLCDNHSPYDNFFDNLCMGLVNYLKEIPDKLPGIKVDSSEQVDSLPKDIKKAIFDFIDLYWNGENEADVMYNLHLEIEDIFWDVERKRQRDNE